MKSASAIPLSLDCCVLLRKDALKEIAAVETQWFQILYIVYVHEYCIRKPRNNWVFIWPRGNSKA